MRLALFRSRHRCSPAWKRVGPRASTSWKLWSAVQDGRGLRHDAQDLFPSAGVLLPQGPHRALRTRHCLRVDPCRSRRREIERSVPSPMAIGKIPVLRDEARNCTVVESTVIIEYLDEEAQPYFGM